MLSTWTTRLPAYGIALGVAVALLAPRVASAHKDPSGETQTGVGMTMEALYADGITPLTEGTVTECETLFFRATLNDQAGAVAFEGGEWLIELPGAAPCVTDGDCAANEKCRDIPVGTAKQCAVDVTPAAGIPCIGGTVNDPNSAANDGRGDDCFLSPSSITSVAVPYTANAADIDPVTMRITARAEYRLGYAHIDFDDLFGVSASTPFPIDVLTCDDGNACTVDTCDPDLVFDQVGDTFRRGACVTEPIPGCVLCETVDDCNDGDVCTSDACVDDVCVSTPIANCCETDGDCDDQDLCTIDSCVDNVCVFPPIEFCEDEPCADSSTCDDGNPCTEDECLIVGDEGVCIAPPIPGCFLCETDADCEDQDLCTIDSCVNDVCVFTPIEFCEDEPCADSSTCDDGNPCTEDECLIVGDEGVCIAPPIPGCFPCQTDADCDDQELCTIDSCVNDVCVFIPIEFCDEDSEPCEDSSTCDDGDPCTEDECLIVGDEGVCIAPPIPDCTPCETAFDCDDGDPCTQELCVDNQCLVADIPDCIPCTTPQECDDQDPCTTNACVEDMCVFTMIPDCRPCTVDGDCRDGDVCTVDVCLDDVCVPLPPFFAKIRGQLGNYGEINGSFGVNDPGGQVRFGRGVFLADGTRTTGDIIRIGNGANVYDLFGNEVRLGSDVVVRGTRGIASLPIAEPFCPVEPFACGTQRVNVGSGASAGPLPPGAYGSVRILNGGTLQLAPGEFTFCEIRTGRLTNIVTNGPTTVNVTGRVRIANGSIFGPGAGSPTPVLNVLGAQVRIGAGSIMKAHLSAPNAMLTMGRQAEFRGTFCALRTRSDKRVILICPDDERPPSSPSGAFVE